MCAAPHPPDKNVDPGRVRFEPLFVAMYGDCKKNEVTRRMRKPPKYTPAELADVPFLKGER